MNARLSLALTIVLVLAALPVAAYHDGYSYAPYGDYTQEYERSRTSESVSSRESESESSSSSYGGRRYYSSADNYNYGRSRDFSFSRTSDYERESTSTNYGYPYGQYARGSSRYDYPSYDVNTGDYRDYRPFSDSYAMGFTSPYYDPYRYSRVGAYASRYRPYGY